MTPIARWVEVHRLAVAGGEAAIARDVGNRVSRGLPIVTATEDGVIQVVPGVVIGHGMAAQAS